MPIHVIGGGLAGSEAAWQAASLGVPVTIHEMRPVRPTAVHKTDRLAELVCSNSFRGDKLDNAVGLLKEEMRRLGSVVMKAADLARVPAGAALAVDRDRFADEVTRAVCAHPLITVRREEIEQIPASLDGPLIIATGPLTSAALSREIAALVGGGHLYFYDAISPIVLAETIDRKKVFRASRWGRNIGPRDGVGAVREPPLQASDACGIDDGEGDYLNCPFTADEYARFYHALISAEKAPLHEFDDAKFFEGCLPIEVMAGRGVDTLRFGPMKPVGLPDPRMGRERIRNRPAPAGQSRRLSLQPGRIPDADEVGRTVARAPLDPRTRKRGVRPLRHDPPQYGTSTDRPCCARPGRCAERDDLFFAGQISGVEGYVESAASGLHRRTQCRRRLVDGRQPSSAAADDRNRRSGLLRLSRRSETLSAVQHHLRHHPAASASAGAARECRRKRRDRNERISQRALADLAEWMKQRDLQPSI